MMINILKKELSFVKFFLGINLFSSTFNFWESLKFGFYSFKAKIYFKPNFLSDKFSSLNQNAFEFLETGATLIENKVTVAVGKSISDKVYKKSKNKLSWKKIEDYNSIYLQDDVLKTFPELENLLTNVLEPVLNKIYKSNYKVFFAVMFKSIPFLNKPTGSQLWHSDGAPGTCVNIIFYPNGVTQSQGAMEFINWKNSRRILIKCNKHIRNNFQNDLFSKDQIRTEKANFYQKCITENKIDVKQPTSKKGAVLLFKNNCIHKGGYPKENFERLSIILNVYPHCEKPNYDNWFKGGRVKVRNIPLKPNFN